MSIFVATLKRHQIWVCVRIKSPKLPEIYSFYCFDLEKKQLLDAWDEHLLTATLLFLIFECKIQWVNKSTSEVSPWTKFTSVHEPSLLFFLSHFFIRKGKGHGHCEFCLRTHLRQTSILSEKAFLTSRQYYLLKSLKASPFKMDAFLKL